MVPHPSNAKLDGSGTAAVEVTAAVLTEFFARQGGAVRAGNENSRLRGLSRLLGCWFLLAVLVAGGDGGDAFEEAL